ncbi:MAG TPA: MerR family transcriptional regulator [bacterium]|jgi:excisionase family DNA binding protein|nr:MerR family transcriptional regulator [bacterium]
MVLLAPKDAASRLGVTTARVQQLAREGKLRELRDSAGRRLFRPQDVERLRRVRVEREKSLAMKQD